MNRSVIPNKMNRTRQANIRDPLLTALIAFEIGKANATHYHDIAGAILIAMQVAKDVARHKHLLQDLRIAAEALNTVFDRKQQRTIEDASWAATQDEKEKISLGVDIYLAMVRTTPGPTLAKAIRKVMQQEGIKEPA